MHKCSRTTKRSTKVTKTFSGHVLDRLDLEVQANQTEDETFQVLHQVVEHTKTFRIPDRQQHVSSSPQTAADTE